MLVRPPARSRGKYWKNRELGDGGAVTNLRKLGLFKQMQMTLNEPNIYRKRAADNAHCDGNAVLSAP